MPATAVLRGGWAGLVAAALFLCSTVIDQLVPVQRPYAAATDYVHQALLLVAFLAVTAAVAGLSRLLAESGRFRPLVMLAAGLTSIGYLLVAASSGLNLVQGGPSLVGMRQAAALALLLGSALLGILARATKALPWWCAALLIIAFPLGDVVDAWFRGGEGVLLALAWGSVGLSLLHRANGSEPALSASTPEARRPTT